MDVGTSTEASKHARWSMYLGASSLMLSILTGIPAIVLGAKALKNLRTADRGPAYVGIALGTVTSLGALALLVAAALMPPEPRTQDGTGTKPSVPASSVQMAPTQAAASAEETQPARAQTPLDLWATKAVAESDFELKDEWALYPSGTTDCGVNVDGKPARLDVPPTSDQFEAHRQEERRASILAQYQGALVAFRSPYLRVEFGDYDFSKRTMPVKVLAQGGWPLGTQVPIFRRRSDSFDSKTKVAELGGKDLVVTGSQEYVSFDNASSLDLVVQVEQDKAERWSKGGAKAEVLVVQKFLGLGYHKVCKSDCTRILGVTDCSPLNVGFGEYVRADLVGYRVVIDDVLVAEKQPALPTDTK